MQRIPLESGERLDTMLTMLPDILPELNHDSLVRGPTLQETIADNAAILAAIKSDASWLARMTPNDPEWPAVSTRLARSIHELSLLFYVFNPEACHDAPSWMADLARTLSALPG